LEAVLPNVLSQFAEEAAFLWTLRAELAVAPHVSLSDLRRWDERIEAQLDGILVSGASGQVWEELLPGDNAGEIFARAVLALDADQEDVFRKVVLKAAPNPGLAPGLISALGWRSYAQVKPRIRALLSSKQPHHRRLGLAAAAAHREDPGTAHDLFLFLNDADPGLRARACRAAGELGRLDVQALLQKVAAGPDLDCRFWANWTLALFGDKNALRSLVTLVETKSPHRERAMHMAIRCIGLTLGRQWLNELMQAPGDMRFAIQAAGALGCAEKVPWLIERMADPALARVAAEAFTQITGADLDREYLKGEPPKDFDAGPNDDPDDDNVAVDPDENLPWPNVSAVEKWWAGHEKQFAAPVRFILGQPISPENLAAALRTGRQRQRAAAALDLALHQRGKPMVEVRAPGFRQLS
jgi:uncharacterized protein (TIGR02270 family)